jgi:hypothetical protein
MTGQRALMHMGNKMWSRLSVWVRLETEGVLMISSPHGIRRQLFHARPSEFFVCGSDWFLLPLECPDGYA